tara:strand:+ start:404 stop:1336 length:933 start_codon:yes stop_codon:yes gene_type:complete
MHKIAILGYRFGIYGYLPALIECGFENIFINEKGKAFLAKIQQLSHLEKFIEWNEEEFSEKYFDNIILALPPIAQYKYITEKSILSRSKNFILEKPIAPSPNQSLNIIHEISKRKINYKVNYSFLYTNWYSTVRNRILSLDADCKVKISWCFKAYHFQHKIDSWKQYNSLGGGAIRFYGIHLIAFLSSLGYLDINESIGYHYSKDIIYKWKCSLTKTELLPEIDLTLDSDASFISFRISCIKNDQENILLNLSSPFEMEENIKGYDQRVSPLIRFIEKKETCSDIGWQENVIELWQSIEDNLILNQNNVK